MTEAMEPKRYVLAFGTAHYAHEELAELPQVADYLPKVLGSLADVGYEPVPFSPEGSMDPTGPLDVLRPSSASTPTSPGKQQTRPRPEDGARRRPGLPGGDADNCAGRWRGRFRCGPRPGPAAGACSACS
ncbi:hypothetical protein [Streptomyces sp. NPDC045714]|uniref:hypothetical protein n=1 Tax=Streptomyces sp. NPDC045714 TaxID=3154913 RepID=UPI0033D13358